MSMPCSFFLYLHFLFVFLIMVILTGLSWDLKGVMICSSLMAKEIKISSIHLLAIGCSFHQQT